MDLKEAVQAAAPGDDSADMPEGQAQRIVEGARHLSPHLGERRRAIQLFGRSIFIRELLPQDLKIELETLTREQAMNIARFLANLVGKDSCTSDGRRHAIEMGQGIKPGANG